jgi:hypothetical protein
MLLLVVFLLIPACVFVAHSREICVLLYILLLAMFMLIPAFCTSFLLFPWKDFYFSSLIFCLLVLVNMNLKISQKHHQTQMMQMMQIMMPQHVINDAISISSPLSTNIC